MDAQLSYIAYSNSKQDVRGIVYNFGRGDKDQLDLAPVHSRAEFNSICVASTGLADVAVITKNAETAGCIGLFLYPDLTVFTDLRRNDTQYGSANFQRGDPSTTPPIPAVKGNTNRKTVQQLIEEGLLPGIPILSISRDQAEELFDTMENAKLISMSTSMYTRIVETQIPVCYFYGKISPDKYVLIGSQRDSFAYGISDALSGTIAQMEVVNVIGEMKANGWENKRTLLFASWGATEYGLIGSYEWVQQYRKKLQSMYVLF